MISSLLLYPIIHELGHVLTAILLKVKIIELRIFPSAYIICELDGQNERDCAIIAMGGLFFPFVILAFNKCQSFLCWYIITLIKLFYVISLMISNISIVIFYSTNLMIDYDIEPILIYFKEYSAVLLVVMCFMAIVMTLSIIKSKPKSKIEKYFDLEIA